MTLTDRAVDFIYHIATGSKRVRTFLAPVGAMVFLSIVAMFIALSLLADQFLKLPPLLSIPLNIVVSLPLLLVGLVIYAWAFLQFRRFKGTPMPFNPPPKVMTTGPYAYCRNPMLDSIFLAMLGVGLLLRSVSLVFLVTPFFVVFNAWMTKAIEEPELARRLGEDYIRYKSTTPMFIPRWPARSLEKRDE